MSKNYPFTRQGQKKDIHYEEENVVKKQQFLYDKFDHHD